MCDSAVASSGDLCLCPCHTEKTGDGGINEREAENNERESRKEDKKAEKDEPRQREDKREC